MTDTTCHKCGGPLTPPGICESCVRIHALSLMRAPRTRMLSNRSLATLLKLRDAHFEAYVIEAIVRLENSEVCEMATTSQFDRVDFDARR